jgi:hypothetical protein
VSVVRSHQIVERPARNAVVDVGDIDDVRLVGPMEPATKRGRSLVEYASAALRAMRAAARFMS